MTPEQIPDEVVELIRFKLVFSEMNSHNIRTALAAGLAAWPEVHEGMRLKRTGESDLVAYPALILPLKETGE